MTTNRKRKEEIFDFLRPRLGEAITRFRGAMSQEHLASEAQMDAGTLRRLEKGRAPFREDYVFGVCGALGIEPEDLLRKMVDCYEQARKSRGPAVHQMSNDEVLDALRKTREAMARLQRELDEIEIEILRRQVTRSDKPAAV